MTSPKPHSGRGSVAELGLSPGLFESRLLFGGPLPLTSHTEGLGGLLLSEKEQ